MAALVAALAATACVPHTSRLAGRLEREALDELSRPVPAPLPLPAGTPADDPEPPRAERIDGSAVFVRKVGRAAPRTPPAGEATVTFNFENQPIEAVARAILADLLDANYSIAPGVAGAISFSTSKPVHREQALPILETLLSWTGNALLRDGDRYTIVPMHQAVAGHVVPGWGAAAPRDGLSARLFPLRHVAATEMEKLLRPFATHDAMLLVDPARNLLVMAGTREQLDNYAATIDTFDVDWIGGMSVGVYGLHYARTDEVVPALEAVFGASSGSPAAGLVRFLPIERTHTVVVIAIDPSHLNRVGEWIERIDRGGGNEPRLYVYDVRNLPAKDVARHLASIYGGAAAGDAMGAVGPGLTGQTMASPDDIGDGAAGTDGSTVMPGSDEGFFEPPTQPSVASSGSDTLRFAAVEANNQVMVHARPAQWKRIRDAIERLDAMPMQVQIETRILEVTLRDNFRFGVQWFLEGYAGSSGSGNLTQPGNAQAWSLGRRPPADTGDTFYYSFVNRNLQSVVRAMEEDTNTRTLSAPSLVVINNRKAVIQVGDEVPVTQTVVNTGTGSGQPVEQVTYKNTGVILKVRPRVNPGGLVYLDISQEVSKINPQPGATGNAPIEKRKLETEVAVQSGQTVLLGGLIREDGSHGRSGVPLLSRVPVLGTLFGNRWDKTARTETIVLITPKVITHAEDARRVADEYRRRFRSLEPFEREARAATPPRTATGRQSG
jgi:general secretion pathway protein D